MRITFLGGADQVGASSLLIEIGGRRVLVDAGIQPSPKARWGLRGDQLPDLAQVDRAGGVDAILVTHAHTDHTGALELLTERYRCPVYATPVTIALTRVLHADSRRIMQTRLDEEGELPLFDDVAVQKLLAAFVPVPVNTRLPLVSGVPVTFFPAGHIAGAAMIGLESDEGRVLVSGDVSVSPQRTVDGLWLPSFQPDVLILESTYGGRLHANRAAEERRLVNTIAQVAGKGGKVLIPAFALGRAQELILILSEFLRRGELSVPVWADGMVRTICAAYAQFPEALPLALQERGAMFFDERIRPVERPDQRNALMWQTDPLVIISSSGMLAGGASVEYARALARQPQNAILLTGYQDEESPGRRLQEMAAKGGGGTLRLGKERVDVQCQLGTYSLSAHADEGQLISLVEALDPGEVVLVHGDEAARESVSRALLARKRIVRLPHNGQSLDFRSIAPPAGHTARQRHQIGLGQPLDLRALWRGAAGPAGGGYFSSAAQIELALKRREQMTAYPDLVGQWLILHKPSSDEDVFQLARCVNLAADRFYVEGDASPHWPEQVVEVIGLCDEPLDVATIERVAATLAPESLLPLETPRPLHEIAQTCEVLGDLTGLAARAAVALALARAEVERTAAGYVLRSKPPRLNSMEPNQALGFVREQFPPEARLRRCGYRLDQRVIALTFDFPDAVQGRYRDLIQRLPADTGWQVEIDPEANQSALAELARTAIEGWMLVKGPAIHREGKRVAVTIAGDANQETIVRACQLFREASGFELTVAISGQVSRLPVVSTSASAGRMEINAAYATLRAALAGSTLYRTSLTGDTIVLSFISQPVGQRYQVEMEALSRQTGWALSINPQPNQGAILEVARKLIAGADWEIVKGPGIRVERGQVEVRLAAWPDETDGAQVTAELERQTGYRLVVAVSTSPSSSPAKLESGDAVEIPLERIRLGATQQGIVLNQDKVLKAVERARRMSKISPPIQVRRLRDGYLLMDGLYRLQAARTLGWQRIEAIVVE